jgi:uncharacterized membrane protein
MNCDEFLKLYREALEGKVPEQIIQDNVNYYRTYIYEETKKGKSETEVIKTLGDPRLLAKTTEESNKFARDNGDFKGEYSGYDNSQYDDTQRKKTKIVRLPSWLIMVIVILLAVVFLAAAFRVAVFVAPFIIAFIIAGFIYRTVRDWFE